MNPLDTTKAAAAGIAEKFTGENPKLFQEVVKLVQNMPDGFSGFVKQFQDKGLGEFVSSFPGQEAKQGISPQQILLGFGSEKINQLALSTGLDPKIVPEKLATILPKVVKQFAPAAKFAGVK